VDIVLKTSEEGRNWGTLVDAPMAPGRVWLSLRVGKILIIYPAAREWSGEIYH